MLNINIFKKYNWLIIFRMIQFKLGSANIRLMCGVLYTFQELEEGVDKPLVANLK